MELFFLQFIFVNIFIFLIYFVKKLNYFNLNSIIIEYIKNLKINFIYVKIIFNVN